MLPILLLITGESPGAPVPWHMPSAKCRIRLERAAQAVWPAPAGHAQISLGTLDPGRCAVSVYAADGAKVRSQILFAAEGETVGLLFDTASPYQGSTYYVYLEGGAAEPAAPPLGGLVVETRRCQPAGLKDANTAWQAWAKAGPTLGRTPAKLIFHGANPHGADANFMTLFSGWFKVEKDGEYEFAVLASGPAFLRVNNELIAQRPVDAVAGRGSRGQYAGKARLKAGRHKIEMLTEHARGEWLAEVAWKTPEDKYLKLMPERAFEPVARFQALDFETPPQTPAQIYFDWQIADHSIFEGLMLVEIKFRALPEVAGSQWRWNFQDGGSSSESSPTHVYLSPGQRRVELEWQGPSGNRASLSQVVSVRPDWSLPHEWLDKSFARHKQLLLRQGLAAATPEDLANLVRLCDKVNERDLMAQAAVVCLARQQEFDARQGDVFYLLGFHFEDPQIRKYQEAELAWRVACRLGAPTIRAKAFLRLGQFQVEVAGQSTEALKTLATVDKTRLTEAEARQCGLLVGDALLLQGKVEEARAAYAKAGALINEISRAQSMRNRARLESARAHVERQDYDVAEDLLKRVEWEEPLERLSVESGLTRIRIFLERKEYPKAITRSLQLLQVVVVDTQRADLLYLLAEARLGMGQKEEAGKTLQKLADEHPYSEAAAKARDKYGVTATPKKRR